MSKREPRARVSRAEWAKRVERWQDSGLTAQEFANEMDISAGTLQQWKYRFDAERRKSSAGEAPARASRQRESMAAGFVEMPVQVTSAIAFELRVGGYRVQVPTSFDATALSRLLTVLEDRQ